MVDDVQWFWGSEWSRDRMLREDLAELQAASAAATARSYRLNSQLADLKGSLDARLTALSSAFDVYVELGDVREQLAGYPDTAAIRRDTASAIDLVSQGGRPDPVDSREVDYWLPYATNAGIELMHGTPDGAAERRALELDRDAEVFVVSALGALGRGELVGDRVPELLVCDGTLTEAQGAIWAAAADGLYGAILPEIRRRWGASLTQSTELAEWTAWVQQQAGSDNARDALVWLDEQSAALVGSASGETPGTALDLTSPAKAQADQTASPPAARLRSLVSELVGRGMPGEAELLSRSRELRARFASASEGHGGLAVARRSDGRMAGETISQAVRSSLAATPPGSKARLELISWVQPQLAATSYPLLAGATEVHEMELSAPSLGGAVPVTADGPDERALALVRANVALLNSPPTTKMVGAVVTGGVCVLLIVWAMIYTDAIALPLILLVGVMVAGLLAGRAVKQRTATRSELATALGAVDSSVAEFVTAARQRQHDQQVLNADLGRLADRVRLQLGAAQTGRLSGPGSAFPSALPV